MSKPDILDRILSLNEEVSLLGRDGDYTKALPIAQKAFCLARDGLGARAFETAATSYNLGMLYRMMGNLPMALQFFRRAYSIFRAALGNENPETWNSLDALGSLLEEMHNFTGALYYYKRALASRRRHLGREDPETLSTINTVAFLYRALGQYRKARRYYQISLTLRRKVLGPHHPDTSESLNNLGAALESLRDYEGAVKCYTDALNILVNRPGADNQVAGIKNNLKGAQELLEQNKPARPTTPEFLSDSASSPPMCSQQSVIEAENAPYLHFRVYMDRLSYSIDFYYETENRDYTERFGNALKSLAAELPRGLRLLPVAFYFTRCERCGYLILTNREHGYRLRCQKCEHTGHTNVIVREHLDAIRQILARESLQQPIGPEFGVLRLCSFSSQGRFLAF